MKKITQKLLKERYIYDRETGTLTNRINLNAGARRGQRAGCFDNKGYRVVGVLGVNHFVHRVAWLYETGEWPKGDIDHIDGDPSNNRISNLRDSTRSQNGANKKSLPLNTSGYKGVSWNKSRCKWCALCGEEYLGGFIYIIDAARAYDKAAIKMYGEFAKTNKTLGFIL